MTAPDSWFGYHMPSFTFPGVPPAGIFEHVVGLAQAAESAGFALITVMDHFYQIRGIGPETEPMLESYSVLSALAARTSRARLGTLVTGVTYRNPAILAKTVTTLDVISGGRAILGIGAAWNEDEHLGYGVPFPPIGERMDRLDEALTICHAMFTQDRPSFTGRHYRIESALNSPWPIRPGGPKIMVGGGGEQRTLRIAASARRHDPLVPDRPRCSCSARPSPGAPLLRRLGRDPSTIQRTVGRRSCWSPRVGGGATSWSSIPPTERGAFIQRADAGPGRRGVAAVPRTRIRGASPSATRRCREVADIDLAGELIRLAA